MPVILVVDDSRTDQALIGELIRKEAIDWVVEFADSAEEALVRMRELAVQVVVTDMMMPGMDGLALLDMVRKRYENVPVILATGEGSEALAAEALRRGAASYVSKKELAARLSETIKQVLQVAESQKSYSVLIESVEDLRVRFQLENDPRLISSLVHLIQQLAQKMKICGAEQSRRIGVAMDEALINAMYHGNLELPRERLREARSLIRDGESVEAIEQRRAEPGYRDRRVFVECSVSTEMLRVTVRDEGHGFDPSNVPRVDDTMMGASEVLHSDGSRGLVLIRNLMDEVEFNESGNQIVMAKQRQTESSEPTVPI